jgi:hypothetical protein
MSETYCAYCGGEIYRYDSVYMTVWGVMHEDCLPEHLKSEIALHTLPPVGAVCAHCGEGFEESEETIELEGEYLHEDCFCEYITSSTFPIDY